MKCSSFLQGHPCFLLYSCLYIDYMLCFLHTIAMRSFFFMGGWPAHIQTRKVQICFFTLSHHLGKSLAFTYSHTNMAKINFHTRTTKKEHRQANTMDLPTLSNDFREYPPNFPQSSLNRVWYSSPNLKLKLQGYFGNPKTILSIHITPFGSRNDKIL